MPFGYLFILDKSDALSYSISMKLPVEISAEVPCHPDYIRKINRGQRTPRPEMFHRIKRAMQRRGVELSFDDLPSMSTPPDPPALEARGISP